MEEMKQLAIPEERETNINIDYFDKVVTIYSNQASVCNRLMKRGYKPSDISKIDGNIFGLTFKFDFDKWPTALNKSLFRAAYTGLKD